MFTCDDYFDKSKIKKPYSGLKEYLSDISSLTCLLLDVTVEDRLDEDGTVYTPGIMMTDEQAQRYYNTSPLERGGGVADEEAIGELELSLRHIKSRENATKKVALPLKMLREEFDLSFFEEMALLLPLSLSLDINLKNLYAYIANNAALKVPTTGVLYSIYQIFDADADLSLLNRLTDRMGKMSIFFLRPLDAADAKKSLLEIPLILRDDVLSFLSLSEAEGGSLSYAGACRSEKTGLNLFKDIAGWKIESEGFVYVGADDPEDVSQFLTEKSDRGVLVVDADHVLFDVKSARTVHGESFIARALGPVFLRVRLTGEALLLKLTETSSWYCPHLLRVVERFLPQRTIYLCGEDSFPKELMTLPSDISYLKLPPSDVDEREEIWNYFLSKEGMKLAGDINVSDLADCYEISFSKIRYAVSETSVKARWKGGKKIDSIDLKEQLRSMGDAGFEQLAVYIPPVYSIDNLEIDETQKKILLAACSRFRIKNRVEKKYGIRRSGAYGNGVSVLLAGPPGTGKTMAAQVISKELSLPLYRVDLSQIISKYIGETQKNINEIFEQAKRSNVILFFDEADALFARRTEVKDSNDKYANAETAYLLQKVEGYNGMTVLATNLYSNFDAAFVRRLTYIIKLQKPDEDTRLVLWKSILPKDVKLSKDIDFEYFAENFDMSGSEIKAVLYSAMYMAAAADKPLGNDDIVRSIQLRPENAGSFKYAGEFGKYSGYRI
ncbi:MAG: ATP-binding protein [Butyrivibrio sp.]|nr:ATP-binding protein [Butyrivibrio sp.]